MKVRFLSSTQRDLQWMQSYYETIFTSGKKNSSKHYFQTKQLLKENPYLGRLVEGLDGVRELNISRTPFAFIYRVSDETIEIIRVWDQRRDRTDLNT